MIDPRVLELASLLVNHSCTLREGERVLIEAIGIPAEVIVTLMRAARAIGATPFVVIKDDRVIREICSTYSQREWEVLANHDLDLLKKVDVFIGIRAQVNVHELIDVSPAQMANTLAYYVDPLHNNYRNRHLKWVVLRWPTPAMAQRCRMSTEAFESFFFSACLIDYPKLEMAMEPLVKLMSRTRHVRVVGPGDTDLSFEITGMPQCKYAGRHNIPDGELFTAPILDSVRGRILFNVTSVYYGTTFERVRLDFKDGKVVDADSDNLDRLKWVLDIDKGARYVGEFAFGFNPYVVHPMNDILFDEKMAGSIHLALGNAYPQCDNSNRSAIHWDLILKQTLDCGGGEVYFDDVLIRRNGLFVLDELVLLNPDKLLRTDLAS